jgi:eukaryotic-like serine/threonine-protein kinase
MNQSSASAPDPASARGAPNDPNGLVGTVLAERYKIEALLGSGGMGTVYRAEHVHMRKKVALKVLHRGIAALDEISARFEREAIAAGRIEHRNVAKAMDFGRLSDGAFYLAMEYVKGKRLTELIGRGPLEPGNALEIARQIAEAINAAHQAGVVHRDLKPDNVMIADSDGHRCWVKVLDFGVAKLATDDASGGSPITRYGAIIGTPEYMAPEQAGGGVVDHRADLYALGVILYELLAGRPPFSADDHIGMISKHFVEPPPPLPASISERTTAIVFELLAKDPSARIQSAAEVVDRIDQVGAELAPTAAVSHPLPPASAGPRVDERASGETARPRWRTKAFAAALLASIAVFAGVVALAVAKRPQQLESASVGIEARAAEAALRRAGSIAPAAMVSAKLETAQASTAPSPSPPPASNSSQAKLATTPRKATSAAPRPGKRYVIRRRIVRRTTITTTR